MKPVAPHAARARGFALVTAMIFLVLLTLVALIAIKGTGIEAKMSANNSLRTQAFESSELSRSQISSLIDALCYADGWPTLIGGQAPNNIFNQTLPAGLTILPAGSPEDWCSSPNDETGGFNPASLHVDANLVLNYPSGGTTPAAGDVPLNANTSVYRLKPVPASGSDAAQVAGYLGSGNASANGGGNVFFYVQSHGTDSTTPQAGYNTVAMYRYVIRPR